MRDKLKMLGQLWRYMGPSWLLFRLKYAAQLRSGWLQRRMPAYRWAARPLSTWLKPGIPTDPYDYAAWRQWARGHFFFDYLPRMPQNIPWNPANAVEEADRTLAGMFRYFSWADYHVGFPPDWHLNPITGQRLPQNAHWTQINDFDQGDIKLFWEASRFGYVYTLVCAYATTHDERYPTAFWELVEDWAANNPPNVGPNWKCGQEAAFRVMAWCFGLYSFAQTKSATPARIAFLSAMVAAHAERIERNIAYARSQKNNHAISEAVGLWTVGLLFPEFERAIHWREQGRKVIETEVDRQIYDDGAYIQHSTNYHRLMLHDLLWALRLGELNDHRLSEGVYRKFEKAVEFLYQLLDIESGGVPNYGANDGALILPLNTCSYSDFRPVIQTGHYLLSQEKLFEPGPWDEDLFWLFGTEALNSQTEDTRIAQIDLSASAGGYYTLRAKQSWVMVRCASYRDRPSQADQLHVDLWWRGINIACDAGTYLYNGEHPWNNGLTTTAVHNTVTVDGKDQMSRVSRFLWLNWAQGTAIHQIESEAGCLQYWEGKHTGYERLESPVKHQRGVLRLGDESWLILDKLSSDSKHDYDLHWLLPGFPYQWDETSAILSLNTSCGPYQVCISPVLNERLTLLQADSNGVIGWRSLSYASREPALSLLLNHRSQTALFWTLFSPPTSSIKASENRIVLQWEDQVAIVDLKDDTSLVRSAELHGKSVQDSLDI